MTCQQILDSLEVVGEAHDWWIKTIDNGGQPMGPYDTRGEAQEDYIGLKKFYRLFRDTME